MDATTRGGSAGASQAAPPRAPSGPRMLSLALLLAAAVGACKVGPDYEPPGPRLPAAYHASLPEAPDAPRADLARWWTVFGDKLLEELVAEAIAGNPGLTEAFARIREASAVAGIATGELYPNLDGEGFARRGRTSENLADADGLLGGTNDSFGVGVAASWELDFWGRVRRNIESADAALAASVEDARDVLVILLAEVADTYIEVRALQARVRHANENAAIQEDTLRLTRDRLETGVGSDLEVAQAERNLATTLSDIPALQEQLARAVHRLATLVAGTPATMWQRVGGEGPIPEADPPLALGIPADLLRRRPDLRRAERSLAAQTAQIGVSTAELYPRFSLDGSFGRVAYEGEKLTEGDSDQWSLGPAFRWNLFDGGRVRSAIKVQEARTEQLLARYEQTLLAAVEDVESALSAWVQQQQRRDVLHGAVGSSEREVSLSRQLYELGITDFENVLIAERELAVVQDRLAQSEGLVARNLVRVFRALGGGWDAPAAEPAAEPLPTAPVPTGDAPAAAPAPAPLAGQAAPTDRRAGSGPASIAALPPAPRRP